MGAIDLHRVSLCVFSFCHYTFCFASTLYIVLFSWVYILKGWVKTKRTHFQHDPIRILSPGILSAIAGDLKRSFPLLWFRFQEHELLPPTWSFSLWPSPSSPSSPPACSGWQGEPIWHRRLTATGKPLRQPGSRRVRAGLLSWLSSCR